MLVLISGVRERDRQQERQREKASERERARDIERAEVRSWRARAEEAEEREQAGGRDGERVG